MVGQQFGDSPEVGIGSQAEGCGWALADRDHLALELSVVLVDISQVRSPSGFFLSVPTSHSETLSPLLYLSLCSRLRSPS